MAASALILLGVGGFIVSMTLCGLVLAVGLKGMLGGAATFILFAICRAIYGSLGCATPSATQAYLASRTRRSARVDGACRRCRRRSAWGRSSARRWRRCSCCRSSACPGRCSPSPLIAHPRVRRDPVVAARRPPRAARRRARRGDELSVAWPRASTGASVVAATSPERTRLKWNDPRIRPWILAGVRRRPCPGGDPDLPRLLRHRPAAARARTARRQSIAIVMMAGAAADAGGAMGPDPAARAWARAR